MTLRKMALKYHGITWHTFPADSVNCCSHDVHRREGPSAHGAQGPAGAMDHLLWMSDRRCHGVLARWVPLSLGRR